MYGALWQVLPGPIWLKVLIMVLLAIAVIAVLFTWVFPWVDGLINPQESTLGLGSGT